MKIVSLRYIIMAVMLLAVCETSWAQGYDRVGCLVDWTPPAFARGAESRGGLDGIAYGDRAWDANRTYRQLVVLLSFSDCDFSFDDARGTYDAIFNTEGYSQRDGAGSVADYFRDQSHGLLNLQFDVYGPYQTSGHVKTGSSSRNEGHSAFREATRMLMAAHPDIDFSVYDWDGDGAVEQVVYVYAGYSGNQSTIVSDGYIWPTTGSFSTISTQDGHRISRYTASGELWVNNISCGIGLICHEFSHCLGLPDIYPTSTAVTDMSIVDEWDLMDGGTGTNYGWCPPNYSPLEKMIMGWLTPTELTADTTITDIRPVAEGGEAYMVRQTDDTFFLIENRQWNGWDYGLPGRGLVVYQVDFSRTLWVGNFVNNEQGEPNYCLLAADGRTFTDWYNEIMSSGVKNPYVDSKRRLNNRILSTAPYPWHTDERSVDRIALSAGMSITDITLRDDGSMSFAFHTTGSGIKTVVTEQKTTGVYTLAGQKIRDDGQTEMLPRGIYIVNGKKWSKR